MKTQYLPNLKNTAAVRGLMDFARKLHDPAKFKFDPKTGQVDYDENDQNVMKVISSLSTVHADLTDTDPKAAATQQKQDSENNIDAMKIFAGQYPTIAKVIGSVHLNNEGKAILANALYAKLTDSSAEGQRWNDAIKAHKDDAKYLQNVILTLVQKTPGLKEKIATLKDTYSVQGQKESVKGKVQMPSLFEVEPDDTMWQEPFISKLGCPMVNFSNPLIKKIISSENAKEEFPKNYKAFKKRLKSAPPAANGATVLDALGAYVGIFGKNPGILLREMAESGDDSVPCHRLKLKVLWKSVENADPQDDNTKVKCLAYKKITKGIDKGKKKGIVELPPAALSTFYTAINPNPSGDPKKNDGVVTYISAAKPSEYNSNATTFEQAYNDFVKYLNENGHPPFILLKPSSKLSETDKMMAKSGRRGMVMVDAEFDGHHVGMFYQKKDAKILFGEG